MPSNIDLLHAAIHSDTIDHAHRFFHSILGLNQIKKFSLTTDLSQKIFSLNQPVDVIVYGNENIQIEVFIAPDIPQPSYEHLCIKVPSKEDFIVRCNTVGLQPYFVDKGDKQLLFVRDFSHNLYEIKE